MFVVRQRLCSSHGSFVVMCARCAQFHIKPTMWGSFISQSLTGLVGWLMLCCSHSGPHCLLLSSDYAPVIIRFAGRELCLLCTVSHHVGFVFSQSLAGLVGRCYAAIRGGHIVCCKAAIMLQSQFVCREVCLLCTVSNYTHPVGSAHLSVAHWVGRIMLCCSHGLSHCFS